MKQANWQPSKIPRQKFSGWGVVFYLLFWRCEFFEAKFRLGHCSGLCFVLFALLSFEDFVKLGFSVDFAFCRVFLVKTFFANSQCLALIVQILEIWHCLSQGMNGKRPQYEVFQANSYACVAGSLAPEFRGQRFFRRSSSEVSHGNLEVLSWLRRSDPKQQTKSTHTALSVQGVLVGLLTALLFSQIYSQKHRHLI